MNSNQTRTLCRVGRNGLSGHNVILVQIMKIIDHVSGQILARRIVYQTFKKNLAHPDVTSQTGPHGQVAQLDRTFVAS